MPFHEVPFQEVPLQLDGSQEALTRVGLPVPSPFQLVPFHDVPFQLVPFQEVPVQEAEAHEASAQPVPPARIVPVRGSNDWLVVTPALSWASRTRPIEPASRKPPEVPSQLVKATVENGTDPCRSMPLTLLGVRLGLACSIIATRPATCGAAIEVPPILK